MNHLIPSRLLLAGVISLVPAVQAVAQSGQPASASSVAQLTTPEAIFAALTDEANPIPLTPEQRAELLKVLDAASSSSPKDARWVCGRAILVGRNGEKESAVELAEQAVKLDPKSAKAHCCYGTALFENINNVGMFSKMGYAGDGRDAYLKAVELDPKYVTPHIGLVQFYANAPGIAGGSMKKARQHADAVVAIGGWATATGHSMLAMLAAKDEDWAEAGEQHRLAADASATPKDKARALVGLGLMLVRDRNDPQGALKIADEVRTLVGPPDDSSADFVAGLARQKLNQPELAVPLFRAVIEKNPDAVNSRFSLAECLEKTDAVAAAKAYEEFAAKFPKDPRAEDAASRAKKLRKAIKSGK